MKKNTMSVVFKRMLEKQFCGYQPLQGVIHKVCHAIADQFIFLCLLDSDIYANNKPYCNPNQLDFFRKKMFGFDNFQD